MSRDAWLIDPWAFARTSGHRDGAMEVADLPRLSGVVAQCGGVFDVRVAGSVGEDKRAYVHVKVSGSVWLTCQRCLDPVEHIVGHDVLFQLWPADAALPDEELLEDTFDALPVGEQLDLAQIVEDEVLLGLPLAPRHQACRLPGLAAEPVEISPFEVLKKLKRPH